MSKNGDGVGTDVDIVESMRSKPQFDGGLVQRAYKYATGAHVHDMAQKLTPYQVFHELYDEKPSDFLVEKIEESERNLRSYVTKLVLASMPMIMADGTGFAPAMAA